MPDLYPRGFQQGVELKSVRQQKEQGTGKDCQQSEGMGEFGIKLPEDNRFWNASSKMCTLDRKIMLYHQYRNFTKKISQQGKSWA